METHESHSYVECHALTSAVEESVTKRPAFGTHWGLVYSRGEDTHMNRGLLKRQEDLDFYV